MSTIISWLVVLAIAAYLLVGVMYARRHSVTAWRQAVAQTEAEWGTTPGIRKTFAPAMKNSTISYHRQAMIRYTLTWPVAQRTGGGLFMGPVVAQQMRVTQLRADAAAWRVKAQVGTDAERAVAADLARTLDEQADALDLRKESD